MSDFKGRFFSETDLRLINHLSAELMSDIVQITIVLFKVSPNDTKTNIYGESSTDEGKTYFPGVEISAFIEDDDISSDDVNYGPDRKQDRVFKIRERAAKQVNFVPEIGDLVLFNGRYHEIDNIVREQLLGGQPDKSHSFILNTHYSRLTNIQVMSQ